MSTPSKKRILETQRALLDESVLGCDFGEAHRRCWCCGRERGLERAHMTPKALGGSDALENFVLLCAECHREAPDVDKGAMLAWLERESSSLPGDRRWLAAHREIERRFSVELVADDAPSWRVVLETLRDNVEDNVSPHLGAGLSHATKVWALERAYQCIPGVRLTKK